jgi:hypothetical protein
LEEDQILNNSPRVRQSIKSGRSSKLCDKDLVDIRSNTVKPSDLVNLQSSLDFGKKGLNKQLFKEDMKQMM